MPGGVYDAKCVCRLGDCWEGIRLRFLQTTILLLKHLLYSVVHFFETLFRLLLPAGCILFLFLLKQATVKNTNNYDVDPELISPLAASNFDSANKEAVNYKDDDSEYHFLLSLQPGSGPGSVFPNGDIIWTLLGNIETVAGFTHDTLNGTMRGFNIDSIDECTGSLCVVSSCDQVKSILARPANESTRLLIMGALCLETYSDGFDYRVYKNVTSFARNPYSQVFDADLPPINPTDYSEHVIQLLFDALVESEIPGAAETVSLEVRRPISAAVQLDFVPMTFGAMFVFTALFLVTVHTHYQINLERNKKLRTGMMNMGLTECAFWASWFIYEMIVVLIGVAGMLIVGYATGLHIFTRTSPVVLFLLFFVTGIWMVGYFMCCSTMVTAPVLTNLNAFAVLILNIGFVAMWIDTTIWENPSSASYFAPGAYVLYGPPLWALYLAPGFTLGRIMWDISALVHDNGKNDIGTDLRFSFQDLFLTTVHHNQFFWHLLVTALPLIVAILAALQCLCCTWYCDNILPRDDYRPQSVFFLCNCQYWGLRRGSDYLQVDVAYSNFNREGAVLPDLDADILEEYRRAISSIREDRQSILVPLKIIKVSKIFTGFLGVASATTALNEVTLCCEKGKVLVVCGHNGAGKTTLINILTGNISASTGDAVVCGHSIDVNPAGARRLMGVCPQYDIIWPELTVRLHMILFANLKGVAIRSQAAEIRRCLSKVNMIKFIDQTARTLSGGQKRRLSLAMAAIGDPKIVFLDEPTSGMDPYIRRQVWDYIQELKKEKVVVLTTHSMEEADVIGDKIAILANGRLRAVGDSLRLKARFGSGYQMNVLCASRDSAAIFQRDLRITLGQSSEIVLESQSGATLTYSIPHDISETSLAFLDFLQQKIAEDLVASSNISHTTLEEVFIRTIHGSKELIAISDQKARLDQELNIVVEGSENPLGVIDILGSWTLVDVRKYVESNFGLKHFVFLSQGGVPLQKRQESRKNAQSYLPLITVRLKSKDEVPHAVPAPAAEVFVVGDDRDEVIRTQAATIVDKDAQIAALQVLVEALREKLATANLDADFAIPTEVISQEIDEMKDEPSVPDFPDVPDVPVVDKSRWPLMCAFCKKQPPKAELFDCGCVLCGMCLDSGIRAGMNCPVCGDPIVSVVEG